MTPLRRFALLAGLLLLAACGGGGEAEPPAPPTPAATEVAAGQASQASIGSSGGSLALATREGASFTLEVPAGALPAATELRLRTATASTRQRFHLRLEPAGLVFEGGHGATLTITLPTAMALPTGAAVAYDGVPLAVQGLADGRLQVKLAAFAGTAAGAAGSERSRALSARTLADAAPACGGAPAAGDFASGGLTGSAVVDIDLYGQCMVGAVQALASSGRYEDAVRAALATAALLQAGGVQGNTGNGTALAFIGQASGVACTAQRAALDAADDATVQTAADVRRHGQPVLMWQKVIEQLGAVCTQLSPTEYIDTMRSLVQRSLAWYEQQLKARLGNTDTTSIDYTNAIGAARGHRDAVRELRSLPAAAGSSVDATAREQIGQRAQGGLIDAIVQPPWQRCRDSGNFDELIKLMQLGDSPTAVKQAAQYCGTLLSARALASAGTAIGTLQPTLGGVRAGELRASGSINLARDGRLELSGPIAALQCPAGQGGGSESLEIRLGNTVLQTISSAPYLANALSIDIAQALQAAGINAATFTSGTLTFTRTGSPCGGFWGDNPVPLLTLQLSAGGCMPPAGYNFCITPILRSDGSPVGAGFQEIAINDRGEVLFASQGGGRLWRQGNVTDLPAGFRNVAHLNNQGTVVGQFDANPPRTNGIDVAVVTAGGSPVILPLPTAPAGLNASNRQILMGPGYLALGDDGTIVGSALIAGIPDPQNLPAGCLVAEHCYYNYILKWSPPYTSYTVLDGPHHVSATQLIHDVDAAGKAVGGRMVQGQARGIHAPYQWNPGAAIGDAQTSGGFAVLIDDRGTVFYRDIDIAFTETFKATATLPHLSAAGLAEAQGVSGINKSGFVQLCGPLTGNEFRMFNVYDGRSWPMTASTLVDPSLGWDFSLIISQCYAWGVNPLTMNRSGHWIGQAPRNGVLTAYILTPRGQPLP